MVRKKKVRDRGKVKLSSYFRKFNEGDSVAIVKELGVRSAFPQRLVGKTGKVIGSQGTYKIVELKDGGKIKKYIMHPIHLKKLEGKKK